MLFKVKVDWAEDRKKEKAERVGKLEGQLKEKARKECDQGSLHKKNMKKR